MNIVPGGTTARNFAPVADFRSRGPLGPAQSVQSRENAHAARPPDPHPNKDFFALIPKHAQILFGSM
jgi:hypothetical protein